MFMCTDFRWAANHCLCAADKRYRVWHNRHRGSRHGDPEELHEDQRAEARRPEERAAASNIQRRAVQECCHEIYPESWSAACLTCGCLQSLLSWFHAPLPRNCQGRLRWLRHCKRRWRAWGVPGSAPPAQQGRACAHGRRGRGGGPAAARQDLPGEAEGDDIV